MVVAQLIQTQVTCQEKAALKIGEHIITEYWQSTQTQNDQEMKDAKSSEK